MITTIHSYTVTRFKKIFKKMCLQFTRYHSFDKHNTCIILHLKQTKYKHNNKRSAEYNFLKKTCTMSFFLMFLHNNAMYQCIKQCIFMTRPSNLYANIFLLQSRNALWKNLTLQTEMSTILKHSYRQI